MVELCRLPCQPCLRRLLACIHYNFGQAFEQLMDQHPAPCCHARLIGRKRRIGGLILARSRWRQRARQARFGAYRRSEEHTSELQSLMRISYAVFCLKKKKQRNSASEYTI